MPPSLLATDCRQLATGLARFEQYEICTLNGDKWELSSAFHDFDLASAVARARSSRVRLMRVVYVDGEAVETQVIAEVGGLREHP